MNLTPRSVALVVGAVALLGLIPDNLSVQTPRTEHISMPAQEVNDLSVVLPPTVVVPPEPRPTNSGDGTPAAVQPTPTITVSETPRPYESLELFVHLPPDAAKYQPLRVLIVLHGMGGRGVLFSQSIVAEADKHHWLLVAPTIPYTNYMDPAILLREDIKYTGLLADMLDDLPKKLGLKLHRHAMLYGFSRGAQLAHRFAFLYPERTESVAAISAGSFTLPTDRKTDDSGQPLKMPYGVGDLEQYLGHSFDRADVAQVSFLIEVGGNDSAANDVPRQFDPYVGATRVDRARAFQNALLANGIDARLIVFPGTAHEMTNEMISQALIFLREEELAKKLND